MYLEEFDDHLNHAILIDRLRKHLDEAGVLRLIRASLHSGIKNDGVVLQRCQGVARRPLSWVPANLILNKVLERYMALCVTAPTATSLRPVEKPASGSWGFCARVTAGSGSW